MKKVLHFVSKMDMAGQETFIMNVYRHINREKIQFNFLCTSSESGDYDEEIMLLGGQLFYLPQLKNLNGVKRYIEEIKNITCWLKNNTDKFDVVHLHTYHALDVFVHLVACRKAHVKNVVMHSHSTIGMHVTLHKVLRVINRMFFKFTALACSKEAGEWLFGKKKFDIVYNGIAVENFTFESEARYRIRRELNIDDKVVFGHVGRLNYLKNHPFLIEVFEKYHQENTNSVLLLVGRGELEKEIRGIVDSKNLDDCIKFLGVHDNVRDYLSAFDIFMFPSLNEGLGIALVEAQINGLPSFVSDVVPREVVIAPNVKFLPINDSNVWVEEIKKSDFSRNTDINMNKFDITQTVKKLENIYLSFN